MDSYRIGQHIVTLDKQTGRLHLAADDSVVQLSAHEAQALLHWLDEQRALLHRRGCRNCGQHASRPIPKSPILGSVYALGFSIGESEPAQILLAPNG